MKKIFLYLLLLVSFASNSQDWRRYDEIHKRYLALRSDTLYLPALTARAYDSTNYKIAVVDANGKVNKMYWAGVNATNTLEQVLNAGNILSAGAWQINGTGGGSLEFSGFGGGLLFNNITTTSALATFSASVNMKYTSTATGITLNATHYVVDVTATGQTITLPTAASIAGRIYTIKLTASGTGTVATTSSQTIDGSTTYSLSAQNKYVTVMSNNANWIIIANN